MKIKNLLNRDALRPLPLVMSSDVMRVAEETMCQCETSAVYVSDGSRIVGVIFQEDFLRLDGAGHDFNRVANLSVTRFMRSHVVSVDPEWSIIDCLRLMAECRVRDLLVVEDDFPLAVFEVEDLVRALLENSRLQEIEESLAQRLPVREHLHSVSSVRN